MHNNEFFNFFIDFGAFLHSILSVLFWILVIYGFDEAVCANMTIISALIHEAGHILFCLMKGKGLKKLRGVANGLKLSKEGEMSYTDELLLCLFGPFANIVVAGICFILIFVSAQSKDYLQMFVFFNLATAASNLLPIEGYDGYRSLWCILSAANASRRFFSMLQALSFVAIVILGFLALYIMYRLDGGYWFYAVFAFLLYGTVDKRIKSTFFEN